MIQTPTPEQFLSAPDPDEPDADDLEVQPEHVDPLTSIAASLRTLVQHLDPTDLVGPAETETADDRLNQAYDDLEAKHAELYALVVEVETIIKPSTSKLANSVRAAIDTWRGVPASEPEPAPPADPAPSPAEVPAVPPATEPLLPAPDAGLEEWRAYARSCGYNGPDVDRANRSQLRTMLGLPHFES